jgi:hypothetical protein
MKIFSGMTRVLGFAVAMTLAACAAEIVQTKTILHDVAPADQKRVTMSQDVTVSSSSGYDRNLPIGSIWEFRGRIEQGDVYRRVDSVLTVEGAQIHEGYLVVAGGEIVGFYLPVERTYSPAKHAVPLTFQ